MVVMEEGWGESGRGMKGEQNTISCLAQMLPFWVVQKHSNPNAAEFPKWEPCGVGSKREVSILLLIHPSFGANQSTHQICREIDDEDDDEDDEDLRDHGRPKRKQNGVQNSNEERRMMMYIGWMQNECVDEEIKNDRGLFVRDDGRGDTKALVFAANF